MEKTKKEELRVGRLMAGIDPLSSLIAIQDERDVFLTRHDAAVFEKKPLLSIGSPFLLEWTLS